MLSSGIREVAKEFSEESGSMIIALIFWKLQFFMKKNFYFLPKNYNHLLNKTFNPENL